MRAYIPAEVERIPQRAATHCRTSHTVVKSPNVTRATNARC